MCALHPSASRLIVSRLLLAASSHAGEDQAFIDSVSQLDDE